MMHVTHVNTMNHATEYVLRRVRSSQCVAVYSRVKK